MNAMLVLGILAIFSMATLPIWPYSHGWSYLCSATLGTLALATLLLPLFAKSKKEKRVSKTKAHPEFIQDQSVPSVSGSRR